MELIASTQKLNIVMLKEHIKVCSLPGKINVKHLESVGYAEEVDKSKK